MSEFEKLMKQWEQEGNYGYNYPDEKTYPIKNKKNKKEPEEYKQGNISKSRSDLKKNKSGKYEVETKLKVKKGLEPKVKRALKKSIIDEVNKKIKGGSIQLDYSSSEEDKTDSESDEDDIKEYGKMLSHLINHIKDKKEPIDKKDVKQSKELIDVIVKKKRGRPRKNSV